VPRLRGWLDDDKHGVHRIGRGATQVLYAGVHVQKHDIRPTQQDVRDQTAQQHALRADATRAPLLDRPKLQETDTPMEGRKALRDIFHSRVQAEIPAHAAGLSAGALGDQILHVRDRLKPCEQRRREAERLTQTGRGVSVHCEHLIALRSVAIRQQGCGRRLAHPAFSRHCDLHTRLH
jgi:hypothetical protein